jgi:undecaprenyl-diphosphatase
MQILSNGRWLKLKTLKITLLSTAFFCALLLFRGIVEGSLIGNSLVAADISIASLMAEFRNPFLVHLFLWITMLGKWQVVVFFSLVLIAILWIWREGFHFMPFFVTLAGSQVFTFLGKVIIQRPRPMMAVYTAHSFSFPSGHAAVSVAFYGFVAYVLVCRTPMWKRKIKYIFAGTLVVLLIGLSRIYLGVHYMSDVWSGYLIGSFWLIIGISLSRCQGAVGPQEVEIQEAQVKWAVPVLVIVALLFFVGFSAIHLQRISFSTGSQSRDMTFLLGKIYPRS